MELMLQIEDTYYYVTKGGKVFSKFSNKFLKSGITTRGYENVILMVNKKRINALIHRLVAKYYLSNPNNYKEVNHIDGIKVNNHFTNLEWCTHSGNVKHAYENDLMKTGNGHHKSKLTEDQVKEIRYLYSLNDTSHRKLGKLFGVDKSVIGDIINRNIWKRVGEK